MTGTEDTITTLRTALEQQQRLVAAQHELIDQLVARVGRLERELAPTDDQDAARPGPPARAEPRELHDPATAEPRPPQADADGVERDRRTDRRGLLRQAGAAAVGVAAGAVALGAADPAAAAQGTFDGNPGVVGTAVPAGGIGVRGDTGTGTGVLGRSQETTGSSIGVEGIVASNDGIGVRGNASNVLGETIGVLGRVLSAAGYGVKGVNASTGTGNTTGVYGESISPNGRGVVGRVDGTSAVGVLGMNEKTAAGLNVGYGVMGIADTEKAVGVWAEAVDGIALAGVSNRAQLRLLGSPLPPGSTAIAREVGEIVLDTNETLWVCVAAGTPGTWRRLGGGGTAGALTLLPSPVRVYDSRPGNPPATGPKTRITGNTTRVLDTKNNGSGVPAGATSVLVTLTVVNGSANGGFLALFAAGAPTPATSSINWSGAGQVVATTTVSAVDPTAQVAVFCPPSSSTDLILDVIGYYQ